MDRFIIRSPKPKVRVAEGGSSAALGASLVPTPSRASTSTAADGSSMSLAPTPSRASTSTAAQRSGMSSAPTPSRASTSTAARRSGLSSAPTPSPVSTSTVKKASRRFQESWKVGHEWLRYDPIKKLMYCTVCVQYKHHIDDYRLKVLQRDGNFIDGCSNFRKNAVVDHHNSKNHMKVVAQKFVADHQHQPEATIAGKALLQLKENERKRLHSLFRNAHALAKHNRPMTDLIWMAELDKAKGIDVGDTYQNEKACALFIDTISAVQQSDIITSIAECNFFSLSMDGSTDISSIEQESIYIRLVTGGEITTRFLRVGEPQSSSADDLYRYLTTVIADMGISNSMDKCVGFACDGAANMLGKKKGMATQLKADHPRIIVVHCFCHRLELAYKDALKSQKKQYDRSVTLLVGLFYFFRNSPKQRKMLKAAFQMREKQPLMPPKVGGTRWMNHMKRAVEWCLRAYVPLADCLTNSSHANPKAEGLVKLLLNYETMAFILLLKDVLDPLAKLSVWLQRPSITLSEVYSMTHVTLDLLSNLKVKNGASLSLLLESGEYEGYKLRGPKPTLAYKNGFIDDLRACLLNRYDDLESPLIASTRIANLSEWPINICEDFGDEEVSLLCQHFYPFQPENCTQMLQEWQLLRLLLQRSYGKKLVTKTWEEINISMHHMGVAKALVLIDLILALPTTSVVNEVSFSQMKLIKTDRRHRMTNERLNALMNVRLNSVDIADFNPDPAIDRWLATPRTKRRTAYKRQEKDSNVEKLPAIETETATLEGQSEATTTEAACEAELVETSAGAGTSINSEEDSESEWEDSDEDLGYDSFDEQDAELNDRMLTELQSDLE